jgi:adenosylcobyric acid synthase
VAGFVINKFRGDDTILAPGLEQLHALTGRPTLGVLPWLEGMWLDAEDSLALEAPRPEAAAALGGDTLEVAVVRLRWMSNFTDVDALTAEPGVSVRFTRSPADVERADLVLVPGRRRRSRTSSACAPGPRRGPARRAAAGRSDPRGLRRLPDARRGASRTTWRAAAARWPASACCPSARASRPRSGCAAWPDGRAGRRRAGHRLRDPPREPSRHGGEAMIDDGTRQGEGCAVGAVLGTSWHGLLEGDASAAACSRGWPRAAAGAGWPAPSRSPPSASAPRTASASSSRRTWTSRRWRP